LRLSVIGGASPMLPALTFRRLGLIGAADINKAAANFRLIKQNCAPQERRAAALLFFDFYQSS
jgi:hypothetical protein